MVPAPDPEGPPMSNKNILLCGLSFIPEPLLLMSIQEPAHSGNKTTNYHSGFKMQFGEKLCLSIFVGFME